MNQDALQRAYAALQARRAGQVGAADVPLETIAELAAGEYRGADRLDLLDRVLANPGLAAELAVFRDLRAARPREARSSLPRRLAVAAVVLVAVGAGYWALRPSTEPVRGNDAGFTIQSPRPNVTVGARDRLIWTSRTDAIRYRVELVDPDGNAVWTAALADTTIAIPDGVLVGDTRAYRILVEALLDDGTTVTAPPVEARGR